MQVEGNALLPVGLFLGPRARHEWAFTGRLLIQHPRCPPLTLECRRATVLYIGLSRFIWMTFNATIIHWSNISSTSERSFPSCSTEENLYVKASKCSFNSVQRGAGLPQPLGLGRGDGSEPKQGLCSAVLGCPTILRRAVNWAAMLVQQSIKQRL